MVEISAAEVKELREMKSAGMMDCKKALTETGGDVQQAKDWRCKKGLAHAAATVGRYGDHGTIHSYLHQSGGAVKGWVLVEVDCATDVRRRHRRVQGAHLRTGLAGRGRSRAVVPP